MESSYAWSDWQTWVVATVLAAVYLLLFWMVGWSVRRAKRLIVGLLWFVLTRIPGVENDEALTDLHEVMLYMSGRVGNLLS